MPISVAELMGSFEKKPGGLISFTEPGCNHWIANMPWPHHGFYGKVFKGSSGQWDIVVQWLSSAFGPHQERYNKAKRFMESLPPGYDPFTYRPSFTQDDGDPNDDYDQWRGWMQATGGLMRLKLEHATGPQLDAIQGINAQHLLHVMRTYAHQIFDYDADNSDACEWGLVLSCCYKAPPLPMQDVSPICPPIFTCDQIKNWTMEQRKYVFCDAPFENEGKSTRIFLSEQQLNNASADVYTAQDGQVPGYTMNGAAPSKFFYQLCHNNNASTPIYADKICASMYFSAILYNNKVYVTGDNMYYQLSDYGSNVFKFTQIEGNWSDIYSTSNKLFLISAID